MPLQEACTPILSGVRGDPKKKKKRKEKDEKKKERKENNIPPQGSSTRRRQGTYPYLNSITFIIRTGLATRSALHAPWPDHVE